MLLSFFFKGFSVYRVQQCSEENHPKNNSKGRALGHVKDICNLLMELLYFWVSQFNWFFNNLPGYDARKMPLGKLSKLTILKVARYQYCGLMPCFDLLLSAELLACTVKLKWNESVPSQACCSLNDGTMTFFTWTVFTHLTRAMRYWRGLLLPWRTQSIQKEMGHYCNWAGTTSKCYL